MFKKNLWLLFAFFAIFVSLSPLNYLFIDKKETLLGLKSAELLADISYNIGFYTHVIIGGIPLLIGWTQFSQKLRNNYIKAHRLIGKIYVLTFLLTAFSGFFIAFNATGGIIPALSFGSVALIAFYTTLKAYWVIRKGNVWEHQKMMIYSYACCFSAVTFRLWQTVLAFSLDNPDLAYKIASSISWLPNLLVAYWIVQRKEKLALT